MHTPSRVRNNFTLSRHFFKRPVHAACRSFSASHDSQAGLSRGLTEQHAAASPFAKLVICCELVQQPQGSPSQALQPRVTHGDRYIHKELRSLTKQIEMSMAANRRAGSIFDIHITSWRPGSDMEVFAQWIKADTWPVTWHQASMHEIFPLDKVVMLSPDANDPLLEVEAGTVYCLGGIVDRTVCKGISLEHASQLKISARRLPVQEYAEQLGMGKGSSRSPVLNISDVAKALIVFKQTGDWVQALREAIPERKKRDTAPRAPRQRASDRAGVKQEQTPAQA